jgi:hypothetical protein
MAWRIVKQPNGKYARFADPVDNFTEYDMTREEAVKFCQDDLGLKSGREKVDRADAEPGRWKNSLEQIELIHGIEERCKTEILILTPLAPEPEPLYYIQDTRTYCGNSVMWWRVDGNGYTSNLEEAWKVPATWKGRDTDKLWLCSDIDAGATRQFDMQSLRNIKPLTKSASME